MSNVTPELSPAERERLNAGALLGVNTVGAIHRDSNWTLRSTPPAPHVEVAPWPMLAQAPATAPPKLSVAIATMNRWHYLKDSLPKYIDNPHIDEIVISDENGFDALQIIHRYGNCKKVKVYINDKRLGAGPNKLRAVSLTTNSWVALLDSDNFADVDYFRAWHSYIQKHGLDQTVIYTPSECHVKDGYANFDFKKYMDRSVSKSNLKDCYKDPLWEMILNNGNFILHKQPYLKDLPSSPALEELTARNSAVEAYLKAGALIIQGMTLKLIPDMKWYHGINKESVFSQNVDLVDSDRSKVWAYFESLI